MGNEKTNSPEASPLKKVLIITYYWPPAGGPGVQRWLKFARYLPEFGYEPIILTVYPDKAEYPIRDLSLAGDIRPEQKVYHTNAAGVYELYKKITKAKTAPYSGFVNEGTPTFTQKIARFIRGNFFLPDARRGWNKHAYKKALLLVREHQIHTVVTTGPPMSTHLVGKKLKKRLHLYWVADFRDPWTDIFYYDKMYPTAIAKRIDRRYEKGVLLQADKVITVGHYIRQQLLSKSPGIPPEKIEVISNGFDTKDFQEAYPKESLFTITYTGTLASDYTIDSFMASVKRLKEEGDFRLRFVGKMDEAITQRFEKELGELLEINSFVPHHEAIAYMKRASLLLLIIPNMPGNQGNITGKLFEYLGSGSPILSLAPPEGDAALIIEKCKAGRTFDYHDEEGIYTFLKSQWQAHQHPSLKTETERETLILQYSRESLTRSLSQIL